MEKNKAAYFILISAVVWGAVIVASSIVLKDTPYRVQMFNILLGGIAVHMLFIWVPLGNQLRKRENQETETN